MRTTTSGVTMIASLAVVPRLGATRPDISWIKKHVPIFEVAKALGLRIWRRRVHCVRPESHSHGDADPSLHLYEKGNRYRCFVCELRGSNVDLAMRVLGMGVSDAVQWIADRFTVPNVKPGRPVASGQREPA